MRKFMRRVAEFTTSHNSGSEGVTDKWVVLMNGGSSTSTQAEEPAHTSA